jgi:hypothetical protein
MGRAFASAGVIQQGFGLRRGCAGIFHTKNTKIIKMAALASYLIDGTEWMIFG